MHMYVCVYTHMHNMYVHTYVCTHSQIMHLYVLPSHRHAYAHSVQYLHMCDISC